jgi:rhodanese-related sulfurtransferase
LSVTQLAHDTLSHRFRLTRAIDVRAALLERREIALLDVREEALHAEGHPLFAANLPLSRLELDAYTRLPRRDVAIVVFDDGEGHAPVAATRLEELGYTDVSLLAGLLPGWRDASLEIFRDVNSPSKAFGELVESKRHTPSLSAEEVQRLIDSRADIVIVDARRYEEFQTMSIPTGTSAPGGELVYRLQGLADSPSTKIIVNCAGRTRSIIGAQSLINAGLPNEVVALRNGTIGWKLARQRLDHGASRTVPFPPPALRASAAAAAQRVADAAGVRRISLREALEWRRAATRTIYLFDVRTPAEYSAGHLNGFHSAPGGQLVQETDMFAPVRGAQIILADDDGARANMTASWLAQMNWEAYVIDGLLPEDFNARGEEPRELAPEPPVPASARISAKTLHQWAEDAETNGNPASLTVLDFSPSREYLRAHIPGAWFASRSAIAEALAAIGTAESYVVTASDNRAASLAWKEVAALASKPVYLLQGGTGTWQSEGYVIDVSQGRFASAPADYYRRPYEGTSASPAAMQGYLDWEFGLIEQLERDGSHGFWVL